MWLVLSVVTGAWLAAEAACWLLVRKLRPSFQWLIGPVDIAPEIPDKEIDKHARSGFDPRLGWSRKPKTSGVDRTSNGNVCYHINDRGCRANPDFDGKPSEIAVFGDSFTFCRLVDDGQTWPHFLSELRRTNVLNFGVGNYGLDQAILYLEEKIDKIDSRIVVIGVVPETMSRIHSFWKHYFEYGNLLAFKPRFSLRDDVLIHHPCLIGAPDDYRRYREHLEMIQRTDPFFRSKFRRDLLAFPFVPRILLRWRRHVPILWHLVLGHASGAMEERRRKAFAAVIADNARVTASLYRDRQACRLFEKLIDRLVGLCRGHGRQPVLLIIPQPIDLARRGRGHRDYEAPIAEIGKKLKTIDVTEMFFADTSGRDLYVQGPLGPHVSVYGNRLIAETLTAALSESSADAR